MESRRFTASSTDDYFLLGASDFDAATCRFLD